MMDEVTRNKLESVGIDVDGTMQRFLGNQELFVKFMKKFTNDQEIIKLKEALANKEYEDVYTSAHTLKGVCANLGMIPLFNVFSLMCQDCRANSYDKLDNLFGQAKIEYDKTVDAINCL